MNGINRRGQKIVCIMEMDIEGPTGIPYDGETPKIDRVYTVADFIDNEGLLAPHAEMNTHAALDLFELPALKLKGQTRRAGWPIICFRPLDERETDISALVGLGIRQTESA
jgi:hypothetical protein